MAEASILMLLTRLAPKIEKKVREEVSLFLHANVEAWNLSIKLKKIQEVLMDAEQKRVMDPKIQSWLQKLQHISYDIGDVLDEWDVANLRRQLEDAANSDESSSWVNKVSSFLESVCLCFKQSVEHRSIALNMKQLNKRLDSVAEENEKDFNFIPNLMKRPDSDQDGVKRIISSSFVDISEVEGRDEDLKMLMKMLLPQNSNSSSNAGELEETIKIVSIVGAGGMGKTTLAQLLFNHVDVDFDVKMWVCVSDPFDQIKIAIAILEALPNTSSNVSNNIETLLQSVKKSISGKRFLLVLDDVWTEDDTMWKPLKISLTKSGGAGSRILVTTRNRRVAEVMGSTLNQIHSLHPLSDSYCWTILSKLAFHERNESDREMLKDIGREITLKCKGLPLAANTLGTLLRFKTSIQDWEDVLNSEMWELEKMRKDLFPILALSYNELQPEVKRCFSYCAVFPKGFVFNVEELIRIWIANGFISFSSTGSSMEEKGRYYFENLAMRSFFQDFRKEEYAPSNCIIVCKMHDIIHDFAQFLTENECLIGEAGMLSKNVRHLNLLKFEADKMSVQDLCLNYKMENLHSFFCTEIAGPELLTYLKRVRSLSLRYYLSKVIPEEIGNLIHLRYLDLSRNLYMSKLPETVCDLYNLQTLNIRFCHALHGLPQGIHKLRNLRHLLNFGTSDGFEFPQGFETLTNLQTLEVFMCSIKIKNKLGYLKDMNQLRGSLTIHVFVDDDDVDSVLEDGKLYLISKKSIQNLIINIYGGSEDVISLKIVESLQPYSPNLPSFEFKGYYLPNWMDTLTNLRKLEISSLIIDHLDLSSLLRNLSFLEYLCLRSMGMKHLSFGITSEIEAQSSASSQAAIVFPKLKILRFTRCHEWEEWQDLREEDHNIFPCLQQLVLYGCSELKALPHCFLRNLSSLHKLQITRCKYLSKRYSEGIGGGDWHQISHIPFLQIQNPWSRN